MRARSINRRSVKLMGGTPLIRKPKAARSRVPIPRRSSWRTRFPTSVRASGRLINTDVNYGHEPGRQIDGPKRRARIIYYYIAFKCWGPVPAAATYAQDDRTMLPISPNTGDYGITSLVATTFRHMRVTNLVPNRHYPYIFHICFNPFLYFLLLYGNIVQITYVMSGRFIYC